MLQSIGLLAALADYIKFDLSTLAPTSWPCSSATPTATPQADLIAEKWRQPSNTTWRRAKGIQMFQGYWFARLSVVQAKAGFAIAGQHS